MFGVYDSHPHYLDTCGKLPGGTLVLLAALSHVHLSPFYHLSTLEITHKQRYQAFCALCITKNGTGLCMRLHKY